MALSSLQNLSPDFKSLMDGLHGSSNVDAVRQAEHELAVEPNCVYLD